MQYHFPVTHHRRARPQNTREGSFIFCFRLQLYSTALWRAPLNSLVRDDLLGLRVCKHSPDVVNQIFAMKPPAPPPHPHFVIHITWPLPETPAREPLLRERLASGAESSSAAVPTYDLDLQVRVILVNLAIEDLPYARDLPRERRRVVRVRKIPLCASVDRDSPFFFAALKNIAAGLSRLSLHQTPDTMAIVSVCLPRVNAIDSAGELGRSVTAMHSQPCSILQGLRMGFVAVLLRHRWRNCWKRCFLVAVPASGWRLARALGINIIHQRPCARWAVGLAGPWPRRHHSDVLKQHAHLKPARTAIFATISLPGTT